MKTERGPCVALRPQLPSWSAHLQFLRFIETDIEVKDLYDDDMPPFPGFMRRPPVGMSTRGFDEYYRCYPIAMLQGPYRESANHGGKIFLPPSSLDKLTRLHITYPMLFELINQREEKSSHAGVLEFIAEEGKAYIPQWVGSDLHTVFFD